MREAKVFLIRLLLKGFKRKYFVSLSQNGSRVKIKVFLVGFLAEAK